MENWYPYNWLSFEWPVADYFWGLTYTAGLCLTQIFCLTYMSDWIEQSKPICSAISLSLFIFFFLLGLKKKTKKKKKKTFSYNNLVDLIPLSDNNWF